MTDAPSPPYLGPPAHYSAGNNKPPTRVVIHCTVSPCARGGARDTAAYFRGRSSGGSAHYAVDPGEVVQPAYDSVICWHAPPNPHSLGVEQCDPMKGKGNRWKDADHQAMLKRGAELVAQLCLAYDIPIQRIDATDLKLGRKGICGHDDVSDAFHQSSHWDPGPAFPWEDFMGMVRRAARGLSAKPVPEPGPDQQSKERARPTRITKLRRILRRMAKRTDDVHRKQSLLAALAELPRR